MKFKALKAVLAASVVATFASSVSAGTAVTPLNVQATVQPKCTVAQPGLMDFGAYVQEGGDILTTANLDVTCPVGVPYTVSIDGLAGGTRIMNHATLSATLEYNLYNDAARTVPFDTTGAGVLNVAAPTVPGPQTTIIYGRIPDNPVNQVTAAGLYRATVSVTVTF